MIELDRIYNEDCLEGMRRVPDGSVDAVICDLPYGTMKGIDDKHDLDVVIPTFPLWEQYERVLRMNGVLVLFSQEPYTSHLRTFKYKNTNIRFMYPMMWRKDSAGNALMAKGAPISYFEDISVFFKRHDETGTHPLRKYFADVLEFIGASSCKEINQVLGHRKAEHCFYVDTKKKVIDKIGGKADHVFRSGGTQFEFCTEQTYNELIEHFGIDKFNGFKTYDELKAIHQKYRRTFNLPEGQQSMGNVFEFAKDTDGFHPTQKPVALIRRLVLTYTNEGDTVLDNCMGSGTTAIACIKERRHFIGFELSKEYFDKAVRRIKAEQAQLTLF